MCWNAEVSLKAFVLGTIAAVIVLSLNVIQFNTVLLIYTITLMQLLEYFAWTYLNNKKINFIISIIGGFILLLQVYIIIISNLKGVEKQYTLLLLFIMTIIALYYNITNNKFRTEKGENGHLKWLWVDFPLPILIVGLFLWVYPPIRNNDLLTSLVIITTLSISLYNYYEYKTWGSMWCYIGNSFWLYLVIKSVYLTINNITKFT